MRAESVRQVEEQPVSSGGGSGQLVNLNITDAALGIHINIRPGKGAEGLAAEILGDLARLFQLD